MAMPEKIQCATHGEAEKAFVCTHLLGESTGLGFNSDGPTAENPFPSAWCDNCEIIRAAHGGWNEESEKLTRISLLCSGCYERSRIRNTRPSITLHDLTGLKWKCTSCEQWHEGPCLDFTYAAPIYWSEEHEKASKKTGLFPSWSKKRSESFLDDDYCAIDGKNFFIRGLIHLPILGVSDTFRWGVWGTLSRENFEMLRERHGDQERGELPPMFSWLSSQIPEYPDMLSLKMYAHIQEPGERPTFRLERTDHPLSAEYHKGISPERVKEIMLRRLRDVR